MPDEPDPLCHTLLQRQRRDFGMRQSRAYRSRGFRDALEDAVYREGADAWHVYPWSFRVRVRRALRATVDSILNQTYDDYELLVR
ncbi:MAG: hypothetical protein R3E12_16555 [Candidatus Eisenbacteria bacterium]